MQNNIIVAEHAGFCFGVKRATDTVEKKIKEKSENEKIYTLGHLIHNDGYVKWLKAQGVFSIEIEDIDNIFETACKDAPVTVYIRAHGISVDVEDKLRECKSKNEFFDYVDLTCPYVKKIHKIAQENSNEDSVFVLLGSAIHPEVIGIMSYARGEKFVFEHANEIENYLNELDQTGFTTIYDNFYNALTEVGNDIFGLFFFGLDKCFLSFFGT